MRRRHAVATSVKDATCQERLKVLPGLGMIGPLPVKNRLKQLTCGAPAVELRLTLPKRGGRHLLASLVVTNLPRITVTKLSQPIGFRYGWMPTVKKCHSISD